MKYIFFILFFIPLITAAQPDSQMGFGTVTSGDTIFLVRKDTVNVDGLTRYVESRRIFTDSTSLDLHLDAEIDNVEARRDSWLQLYSRDSLEVLRLMKIKSEFDLMGMGILGKPSPQPTPNIPTPQPRQHHQPRRLRKL
jgi:hypothetical protein